MPATQGAIFWAIPCPTGRGLHRVSQPQTQTLKELISQLPRMRLFLFLHRNFQSRCHMGQDKVIFRVHLSRRMYVLVPQVWLSFASCGKGKGKPKGKPLLLPCPPLPWVKCMFQLDLTQHRVGRHLSRDQLHRASLVVSVRQLTWKWGNWRPGRVGIKEWGGRWEAHGVSTGLSLISHGW